jgi:hypothetical protein
MAASKATADAMRDIDASSIVSAMAFSCCEFAIRVSGLGDTWFRAPVPAFQATLFEGFRAEDIICMGGDSVINETVGLGGLAQAAAVTLQDYAGGIEEMIRRNRDMYEITTAEHPEYRIPQLGFRGVPIGIDIHKVVATGITPVCITGIPGREGGQIGAGSLFAPIECFEEAANAYAERYG